MRYRLKFLGVAALSFWVIGCLENSPPPSFMPDKDQGMEQPDQEQNLATLPDGELNPLDSTLGGDTSTPPPTSTRVPESLSVSEYCEVTVGLFCPFYLRCNRMAVESLQECRDVFLETCNERYEPIYQRLVENGFLELSQRGISACEEHLADVSCEQQNFDLDGGCSGVWRAWAVKGHRAAMGSRAWSAPRDTLAKLIRACVVDVQLCLNRAHNAVPKNPVRVPYSVMRAPANPEGNPMLPA